MNAMTAANTAAALALTDADIRIADVAVDFGAVNALEVKKQLAADVRELARIEAEIGKLEADSKALKAKFAGCGHDVVYAGTTLVTITVAGAAEILDAEALLTALGMTKEEAIKQGYSKSRAGSTTVKTGALGRTNSPTQKIKDGKRVFVAE